MELVSDLPSPSHLIPSILSVNLKKTSTATSTAGFDNKAFQHQRHFSQATTASTKNSPPPPPGSESTPKGMGETNYQEWLREVSIPSPSPAVSIQSVLSKSKQLRSRERWID